MHDSRTTHNAVYIPRLYSSVVQCWSVTIHHVPAATNCFYWHCDIVRWSCSSNAI